MVDVQAYKTGTYEYAWRTWTSSASTDDTTWYTWGDTAATSAASTWGTWSDTTSTVYKAVAQDACWRWWMQNGVRGPAIHAAQPRVDPRIAEAAREEERQKRAIRGEAQKTAEKLLLDHLNLEQQASYRSDRKFRVIGQDGSEYEVDCRKHHSNIRRLVGDRAVEEFCIYMKGAVPLADNLLAQKLMLECDLKELKRIANKYDLRHMAA